MIMGLPVSLVLVILEKMVGGKDTEYEKRSCVLLQLGN